MRTLHLAPGHVSNDTRVYWKEARTLAAAGHEVAIVAIGSDDSCDGVDVIGLRRAPNRLLRFSLNPVHCLRAVRRFRPDVVHVHDFEALPVGLVVALTGRPVILDSHEDYPKLVLDRSWIPRRLRRLVSGLVATFERVVARRMSAIISAEPEGAKRFPRDRTVVVQNFVLRDDVVRDLPDPASKVSVECPKASAVYVGAFTRERGALEMVESVGLIDPDIDVELKLIGDISPDLRREMEARPGWARVRALGRLGHAEVVAELRGSTVGLVLWHPTHKHVGGAIPVKLFEYFAAGLPVVASDLPAIRGFVEAHDVGMLVDATDPMAVASCLESLARRPRAAAEMGRRAAETVLREHTWESQAPVLLEVYERIRR